jgi:hypothetical protein
MTQLEAVQRFFFANPNEDHRLHEVRDAVVVRVGHFCSETSVSARIREARVIFKHNQRDIKMSRHSDGCYYYRYVIEEGVQEEMFDAQV